MRRGSKRRSSKRRKATDDNSNFIFDEEVYVEDVKIGAVSNGQSRTFDVAPGAHKLQLKMTYPILSMFFKSHPTDFRIESGEALKFNCDYIFGAFATVTGLAFFTALFNGFKVIVCGVKPLALAMGI